MYERKYMDQDNFDINYRNNNNNKYNNQYYKQANNSLDQYHSPQFGTTLNKN